MTDARITESTPEKTDDSRSVIKAMWAGFLCRCPNCRSGKLFRKYLKVVDTCSHCNQELHHHQADDGPPYFTMFIVGHLIVPGILIVEKFWQPALWVHFSLWLPLTLFLSLILLPSVKGAVVGLQWAIKMHGFDYSSRSQDTGDLSDKA